MFFQGVMERVLVELALPTPFPPLPSSPTTPQPLSYHPHKIRKSRKNRIAFSPGTSLNLLYQQLALNSLRIQSPSTISTPISKFNFFDDISEHLFFYPSILFTLLFYSHGHSSSPLLNRTLLSFRCLLTKEPPLLYLTGSLFATLFFHTSSIHYPLTHIHKPLLSPFCDRFFLSQPHLIAIFITIVSLPVFLYILLLIFYPADKNRKNPKKVKFHIILPMASFHRKNLHSNNCFP